MTAPSGLNISHMFRNLLTAAAAIGDVSNSRYEPVHATRKLQEITCMVPIRNAYYVCSDNSTSLACISEMDSSVDACIDGKVSPYCHEKMFSLITVGCKDFNEFNQTVYNGLQRDEDHCPNLSCSKSVAKTVLCKFVPESGISEFERTIDETVTKSCREIKGSDSPSGMPTQVISSPPSDFPSLSPLAVPSKAPSHTPSLEPSQAPSHDNLRTGSPTSSPSSLSTTQPPSKSSSSVGGIDKSELAITGALAVIVGANLI